MSLATSRILVIGCGNMGAAIINGIVDRHPGVKIVALDPAVDRALSLLKHPELVAVRQPSEVSKSDLFDLVLLAIKPQMWAQSATELAPLVQGALVVSIITGIKTMALRTGLETDRVIRAMPNLAAEIGHSMTVAFAGSNLSSSDKALATSLFTCIGWVEWLPKEADVDRATSVSGCGPGFIFAIAENLIEAAKSEGLSSEVADTLVRQMLFGSAMLLASTTRSPGSLKAAVASPRGTTEAGLAVLQHEDVLARLLSRAVQAAHERAHELGS
ncbi:pyrroline-5-carboxylate reductase [Mesorhizobium sp. NPDC059054]|uniref:pyrroline-5-carboxylate reductase n=1 Tax=Mesorhizobium sp. NPDC059054 TaxID=3346711 RepID=UPI0036855159